MDQLPDGWTIYVWLIAGAMIVVGVVFAIWWAYRNQQFDEDIKYLVFDENDRDKMSKEDFDKSREVLKEQTALRQEFLQQREEERAARHEKR